MVAAFHHVHRLRTPHNGVTGRKLHVLHHIPVKLIVHLRTQSLFYIIQLGSSSKIVIIQLHTHLLGCLEVDTQLGILQTGSYSLPSRSIEIVHRSIELMMCSVKRIECFELVTFPVTATQIIITQAHTPLLVYGIGSLHAYHKGRYTLRILVLSGLIIESSLHR